MGEIERKNGIRACIEVALLCSAILVLWAVLLLPVIFFHVPLIPPAANSNSSFLDEIDQTCSSPRPYTGGVCHTTLVGLLNSAGCPTNRSMAVRVSANSEAFARSAISLFNQATPTQECMEAMMSFFCLLLFGLCGMEGEKILPTAAACEEVQLGSCASEWIAISSLGFELPNCQMLPDEVNVSCPSEPNRGNESSSLKCQSDFFFDKELQVCLADCQSWSQYGEVETTALQVSVLISNIIGVLLAIAAVVVSIIRHRSMCQVPSIFLVYSSIDVMVLGIFFIVGSTNTSLFCSMRHIQYDIISPFCVISGVVVTYCILQLSLWWLFHLTVFFVGVWFPFRYEKWKTSTTLRNIQIIFTLGGIFLPAISIIAAMSRFADSARHSDDDDFISGGLGYSLANQPTILCFPNDGFYEFIFPVDLILGVGGPLAFLIFYRFYNNKKLMGAAEFKLMLVLCYYMLITLISIANFSLMLRNESKLQTRIQDYFLCESQGITSRCQRNFEEFNNTVVLALTLVILALYPLYVLVFAINCREVKERYKTISEKLQPNSRT